MVHLMSNQNELKKPLIDNLISSTKAICTTSRNQYKMETTNRVRIKRHPALVAAGVALLVVGAAALLLWLFPQGDIEAAKVAQTDLDIAKALELFKEVQQEEMGMAIETERKINQRFDRLEYAVKIDTITTLLRLTIRKYRQPTGIISELLSQEISMLQTAKLLPLAGEEKTIEFIKPALLADVSIGRLNGSTLCSETAILARLVYYRPCLYTSMIVRIMNGMIMVKNRFNKKCALLHRFSALQLLDGSHHMMSREFDIDCGEKEMKHFTLSPGVDHRTTVIIVTGKQLTLEIDCSTADSGELKKERLILKQAESYTIHPSCFIKLNAEGKAISRSIPVKSYSGHKNSLSNFQSNFFTSGQEMYQNNTGESNPHVVKLKQLIAEEQARISLVEADANAEKRMSFPLWANIMTMIIGIAALILVILLTVCYLRTRKNNSDRQIINESLTMELRKLRFERDKLAV